MSQPPGRDSLGLVALAVLAPVCCLGLPLLLAAGAGAGLWIIGAGLPVAIAVLVGGIMIARWWRARPRASSRRASDVVPAVSPRQD